MIEKQSLHLLEICLNEDLCETFLFLSLQGKMLRGNSTVEMREEAKRISMEGREEEAREILTKLNDTKWVAELAVWRVIEKLNVVLIEEPAVLVGVEEVQWIQKKLMRLGVIYGYDFTEELMDVAYDFKDVIDDLVLRAAAKQRRGNWERCFLINQDSQEVGIDQV